MTSPFADHFSAVALGYASFRPRYPDALFDWLGRIAPARNLAWDCAAGSGQATLALTAHFGRVIATDASEAQLRAAPSHPRVEYRVAPAEASGLPPAAVDLVTVAQAVHWFDFDRFYAEVQRVARRGAILAVWSYGGTRIDGGAIDRIVDRFYHSVVGPYWPPERRFIEEEYRTIPFPFDEIEPPSFDMMTSWTLAQFIGYLGTWSSVWRYRQARGEDPVAPLEAELAPLWGGPGDTRDVRWPLAVRAGSIA